MRAGDVVRVRFGPAPTYDTILGRYHDNDTEYEFAHIVRVMKNGHLIVKFVRIDMNMMVHPEEVDEFHAAA